MEKNWRCGGRKGGSVENCWYWEEGSGGKLAFCMGMEPGRWEGWEEGAGKAPKGRGGY